ncbi:MAG: hypothetical protein ATN33_01805 [Epulopiscium sp. Nele67-Bin001]|nr:MAG: hypothetical protein BEN18_11265 [Epulopiscium sp. Nuni2H_MBin001]OON91044.1 MAG: hypothetical protein ATN33_01805 [Epulopiscium sp. Nele67-Bin001]
MKSNTFKVTCLGVLIVLSIVQTMGLWLGEPLSHNFFGIKNTPTMVLKPIKPESIWLNTGGEYTQAYRITDSQNEYEGIVEELQHVLLDYEGFDQVGYSSGDWASIFNQKGIVYEYSIPVTMDEILGKAVVLPYDYKIHSVFVKLGESSIADDTIYFINEIDNYYVTININSTPYEFANIYSLFEVDNSTNIKYQPSIKDIKAQYIEGNTFLANISEAQPLYYVPIMFRNDLLGVDNKMLMLEGYVDQFFEKPIMKEVKTLYNGVIEFTEPLKSIIRYQDVGVMQYVNLTATVDPRAMSRLEAYNLATDFIRGINSIPASLKDNLYLSDVRVSQGAYVFDFDVMYDEHKVCIGQNLKSMLDISSAVTVLVKTHKVMECKWLTYSIYRAVETSQTKVTEGYATPIDKMYANLRTLEIKHPVFANVELIYNLTAVNTLSNIQWGVNYQGIWYLP